VAVLCSRLPFAYVAAGLAAAVVVLVVTARQVDEPFWGTSYVVLLAMLVCAGVLVATYLRLDQGWVTWRQAVVALTLAAIAYPGWWAALTLAGEADPGGPLTWALAVSGAVGHLPLLAGFSLLPLLAVRYLGRGSGRLLVGFVVALLVADVAVTILFFGSFEPFDEIEPLVDWPTGATLAMVVNLLFLATVLLGPLASLVAAWRAEGEAVRRLAMVAGSALAGAALVMLCGVLATLSGDAAVIVLFCAMYAAVTLVVLGSSRALTVVHPEAESDRISDAAPGAVPAGVPTVAPTRRFGPLTHRETEVLGLLAQGLSNQGIAARLVLSERTVDAHLRSIFTKLDLPEGPHDNRRVHAVLTWREGNVGERADAV
jgi:DNA-binding NarL/FixJ family response regulator